MDIGYLRVSSEGQNTSRQLDGVPVERVFEEKVSGSTRNRPVLEECLSFCRDGDTLHVHSLDRLARNLVDLRNIVSELLSRKVSVKFHKENLHFMPGEVSPMGTLLLSMLGAFAEFERSLIRERQSEGIAQAKKKGVYKGRKPSLTIVQVEDLKRRIALGENKSLLAKSFNISRASLYNYIQAQCD